jgi:serine/threonine protein kinase
VEAETGNELEAVEAICRTDPQTAHVIRVYEIWHMKLPHDEATCLVLKMDRCTDTLEGYLKHLQTNRSSITFHEIIEIMIHVLTGLAHCHTLNYCHRDLKLQNSTCFCLKKLTK